MKKHSTSRRTLEYIKAVELAAKNLKERPTLAGMIGPFSLAGRLFDMTEIMVNIMVEPDGVMKNSSVDEVLKKTEELLNRYRLQ
ncbi:MAG TPA: hypothetical protein PK733_12190 [Clostridiales bacterium]|nr:hypothetical protein [Clostridiales bacterium]